jgi:hypothetical protein
MHTGGKHRDTASEAAGIDLSILIASGTDQTAQTGDTAKMVETGININNRRKVKADWNSAIAIAPAPNGAGRDARAYKVILRNEFDGGAVKV